jgi:hypothetical protein
VSVVRLDEDSAALVVIRTNDPRYPAGIDPSATP